MKKRLSMLLPAMVIVIVAAVVAFAGLISSEGSGSGSGSRSYEIPSVRIDATVDQDGVLHVVETRAFDFDGSFSGVYWEIPSGYNGNNQREVDVSVRSVSVGAERLVESGSGANGTYEVRDLGSIQRITVYSAQRDDSVSFTVAYDLAGVVTRWSDTGEVYWKFVSDGWDVASNNVTCSLHLPVPEGTSLDPGEVVRAWGHGPLDASVSFSGSTVDFDVPGVGTEEFAEMRVTFPAEWVSGLEETPGDVLPQILSEEQAWADEANARRSLTRALIGLALVAGTGVPVACVIVALRKRARYRRDFAPRFADAYFRDVPTDDHPAVLGALYNGGSAETKDLTATLMRLTDEGIVRLDRVTRRRRGLLGEKTEEDYRVSLVGDAAPDRDSSSEAEADGRRIDEATLAFLFDDVSGERDDDGTPVLYFSELEALAKRDPERYSDALESWQGKVMGAYLSRFSGNGLRGYGKGLLAALATLCALLGIACAAYLVSAGVSVTIPAVVGVAAVVGIVTCASAAVSMRDVNRDAVEVRARLDALRNWLCDFTRLEEAVPTDVTLWNHLLVMAVVLGVADEVIAQLRVAAPEVVDSPRFMPTYGWCFWHGHSTASAASAFSQSLDAAHDVSAAALASSSSSSAGGGGGGFSGGGGGGFGGGGGGGAF